MAKEKEYPANQERIQKQKDLLIEQIKKPPVIEVACQKVGVGRTTFYRWQRDDPDFEAACVDALGTGVDLINDLAESKLIGQIQDSNFAAIRFWLQSHHTSYKAKLEISAETKKELTSEEQETMQQAYKRLGLIQSNNLIGPYDQSNSGSEDTRPDPNQQDSQTGSSDEVA